MACMNPISSLTTTITPALSTLTPVPSDGSALAPRARPGRPTGYSEEMVGRLCELIRRRGKSDAAAAAAFDIPKSTLARWKHEHPELAGWLAMAREQYRDAKLEIVDEAKTADGRPDWRAAAWALQKAFPEDYGPSAGKKREEEPKINPVTGCTREEEEAELARLIQEMEAERRERNRER